MKIIKAQKEHIAIIVAFQQRMAFETENLQLDNECLTKGVKSVFEDSGKGEYYIAIKNETVVASLLITYEWSDWRNGFVFWIQSVYVLPEYRRQGVFRQMYSYIKELVLNTPNALGIRLYVEKDNLIAQKTYSALGMDSEHYKMNEWFK